MKIKITKDLYKKVVVLIFIGLIFGPGIIWSIFGVMIEEGSTVDDENRVLAEEPVFDIREIEKYPREYEKYFDDHAPFRTLITEIWSKLNYRIFNDSSSDSVVVGKTDGGKRETWLFYSSDDDINPVLDVQGFTTFPDDIWENIHTALVKNRKTWDKLGADFYVMVVPNKENIYREYLPDDVVIYDDESRGDKLMDQIERSDLDGIIYLKSDFLDLKSKNVGQMYYKQDTHWNKLGAFYGYQKLMEMIEPEFDTSNYKVLEGGRVLEKRDLAKMLGMKNYFVDIEQEVNYMDGSVYTETIENYKGAELQIFKNKNAPIKKKLFVVGDSFREALVPYLAKTFSEVDVIHVRDFNTKVYQYFNPDIVLLETVERYASGALELEF